MEFHPLTPERWADMERLFGPNDGCSGCWCMWWRLTRAQFEHKKGEANRRAMKAVVDSGKIPGIMGYLNGEPVGWCSVAPRSEFGSLNRSRVLKPIGGQGVWSIVCFFVARQHRRKGISVQLIRAALDFVGRQGGAIVEAYPEAPRSERVSPSSAYMGFPGVYAAAGFVEAARPSATRRIMRYYTADARPGSDQIGSKAYK